MRGMCGLCHVLRACHWKIAIEIEQCFTSPPTQYRLYGRRFLQFKRPNQQYQSTEGRGYKSKEKPEKSNNTKYSNTISDTHTIP